MDVVGLGKFWITNQGSDTTSNLMTRFKQVVTTRTSQWKARTVELVRSGGVPNLTVTDETDQAWLGWGGCFNELGWETLSLLPRGKQERILGDLFDPTGACRFTFCRLPIGANDYSLDWYSMNERAGDFKMRNFSIERDRQRLIPYIKRAQEHCPNLRLFASPWSPPTWMKRPAVHNYGTFVMEKPYLQAYALYMLKFVQAYEAEGIPIEQIHVQNEPISSQKFPSCVWSGKQLKVFIRDYLGPLFKRRGVPTDIWLGTLNGPPTDSRFLTTGFNQYANKVLEDSKARAFIKGIGYQWDGKFAIQRTRQAWPEMPLMQTENECGDGRNTWDYAFYVFDLMYHYIVNGACAYIYWNMILKPGGESSWGWRQNAMITVDPSTRAATLNPEYYVMKHFSHFIRPGAKRIRLTGPWSANSVAFRDNRNTTLVVRNPFSEKKSVILGLSGRTHRLSLAPDSITTLCLPLS